MRFVLIGATGQVGSRILDEALSRGHRVTAIVRDPKKLKPRKDLTIVPGDVLDVDKLAALVAGNEAIVSAYNGKRGSPDYKTAVFGAYHGIIAAAKKAGVQRLLVVGGAGSLEVAPGVALVDTPEFPEAYKTEALTFRDILNEFLKENELEWSYLSPSMMIFPGQRTGRYRLGGDRLLKDGAGKSQISMEDFAVAMLDEAERPHHIRKRFTVGY